MPAPPRLPPLLPTPRRSEPRRGAFVLRDGVPVVLEAGAPDRVFEAAGVLRDAVRHACGVALAIECHARSDGLGPHIALRAEGENGEGYRLDVGPRGIALSGAGPAGVRYGVETLAQLVTARGRVPACRIDDAPSLRLRGILLDVSRGKVPTAATLFGLVDLCVRLKLNALVLYVEHPFRFRRHPQIGEGSSALDAATLRALDAYAAARHVDLIPCLQSLGHMERILSLERYAPLAESEARWTLSPADPGSYALLGDLYDEFLPNFRSPWFHANCDEPFDLGHGRSAGRERALGPGGVYVEHVHRVRELARAHGKRTMIWGDVLHAHPERLDDLERDLVLLDWWYEAEHDYDRVAALAARGLEFVVCPGTSTWNCLFPRVANSLENIARYAEAGRRHGALGLLLTDWGDLGHYNLQGNSWLAYAWAAQQAWSGGTGPREFDRAFGRVLFGDASGETARLFRELGAVHEAGFPIFNGSPLQFLFFDDLDRAFFVDGARPAVLRRSLRRLERVRARIARARPRFARDELTWAELAYAADASLLAVRKALAGGATLAWRRAPGRLDGRARRRLARELTGLAREQARLGLRLRRLWRARSEPSDLERTKRRIDRSVRSLRRAARSLERDRPAPPPPPHPGFGVREVFRAARASLDAQPSGQR